MRTSTNILLALCAILPSFGCGSTPAEESFDSDTFRAYTSAGSRVQGSLMLHGPELTGVTQLDNGSCLTEEATLDRSGRLVEATIWLADGSGDAPTRWQLDARRGVIELSEPARKIRWSVPTDLPWVWQPVLAASTSQSPVTSPLSALVAFRGVGSDSAVRSLDLRALRSYTVTADQIAVGEPGATTVVLGDDAVDIADELPARIHHAAFDSELLARDPQASPQLAAMSCAWHEADRQL